MNSDDLNLNLIQNRYDAKVVVSAPTHHGLLHDAEAVLLASHPPLYVLPHDADIIVVSARGQ